MARRILIYSHDTFGLGNIRRNHALAMFLVQRLPDIRVLLLTSSRWFHLLPTHPHVEFVKLPELLRTERGQYRPRSKGVDLDPLVRVRQEILLGTTRGFQPDLFLVDKVPSGTGGELLPSLARHRSRGERAVLLLRDVLDDPEWTRRSWRESGQYDVLARFYQGAWIIGDEKVYPTADVYGLSEIPGLDVRYCGYLTKPNDASPTGPEQGSGERPDRILCTVGGGEDGQQFLELTTAALEETPPAERTRTDIVFGPYLPDADRQRLRERLSRLPDVRCVDYLADIPRRIRSAMGVVSMGGYNTVCEILATQTPALVIPRTRPGQEQVIRASRMSSLGFFRAAVPNAHSHRHVMEMIRDFLRAPGPRVHPRPNLDGLEHISRFVQMA